MKQELENKRPDSEERRSIWQRWKQNLKDWVWFCKEHPDWLDLDVQTWVSTHIGQPLRRRWHRLRELRHQNRQRQLPETEWKLGQLLLFLWGSLPRMGSDLRERLTRRRKGAIRSGGRMRAFFEGVKLHPAVFVAGAVAVTAVAVCLSMYTIGATARYDGVELGTVHSARSVSAAVDQLEEITRQTLSDTDYSIDSAKLEVRTGIVARKELESTDALEENLTRQLGLVDYAYVLYVEGEPVAATTFPGAIEQLLEQLKKGYITDSTVDCYFVENVEVKQEYVDQSLIMNLGYIAEKLNATKAGEVTYTVKSGDVWSLIAEDNGMTNEELLALNPGYDITANVTVINGTETAREVVSSVTLKEPVAERQARGTKERPTWFPTGSFRWPCYGVITSYFGGRNTGISGASSYHEAIDIANSYGTPIYAADGGTVIYSGWNGGLGYCVKIDHGNGFITWYGHNSDLYVSVGDHVYKGQTIAAMGSTGISSGSHCDFRIQRNGTMVDPLNYLP